MTGIKRAPHRRAVPNARRCLETAAGSHATTLLRFNPSPSAVDAAWRTLEGAALDYAKAKGWTPPAKVKP